jgi:hypothetical protein
VGHTLGDILQHKVPRTRGTGQILQEFLFQPDRPFV